MNTESSDSQMKFPSSPLPFTTLQNVLFLCLSLSFRRPVLSVIPFTQLLIASKLYPISGVSHAFFLICQFMKLVVLAKIILYQRQYQCSHHLPDSPAVTTVSSVGFSQPFPCLISAGLHLYEHFVVVALSWLWLNGGPSE